MERRGLIERPLLVLDTATRTPVVALADAMGQVHAERRWSSRHRHGEQLLEEIGGLLAGSGVTNREIGGVIVGTGPGSFTGLRIGLATAKVIAYALDVPIVGISTTLALGLASGFPDVVVSLPAGAVDRYIHHIQVVDGTAQEVETPHLVAGPDAFAEAVRGAAVVAVDIDGEDVPDEPGRSALDGLAAAMARLGVAELDGGRRSDPVTLVPAYVALPRGIARAAAEMEWSPDLR
jgi:tRNA threonylcarbamoyladenosine biosynthesis protein TsaB